MDKGKTYASKQKILTTPADFWDDSTCHCVCDPWHTKSRRLAL
ncbi:MAG TPA: hypothetical protein DCE42_15160 [Myxococcales bacterium]|nr:hypothetical protein [Myxococcales bacterium]